MFKLRSVFEPRGDQQKAIKALVEGLEHKRAQVLLGVTGSGKTFTMANVIAKHNKPTLVLVHNKTLAAQLFQEFKELFPENAVEYFVSYYDYYQPEAYIARTDTFIEKDKTINEYIEKMRLRATASLLERNDVIVVSSVSCIYGLGTPDYYAHMILEFHTNQKIRRDTVLLHLVELRYTRKDYELTRGSFRVRGDVLDILPSYEDEIAFRIEFFDDVVESIRTIDALSGKTLKIVNTAKIYPASHHVTPAHITASALATIKMELLERSKYFAENNLLVEQQRIEQRTRHDLAMIKEQGHCSGIENYSRHFSKRAPGSPPHCLLNYFKEDFLFFIDESHQTIPQIRAMYSGDKARKTALVEYGFRLPSAFDNRPLKFDEVYKFFNKMVYVSATPSAWELEDANNNVVEQIIRPTYLLDPQVTVKPALHQIDDSLEEIKKEVAAGRAVLVTALTKKLSEDIAKFLNDVAVRAKYLHSDIDTVERVRIIKALRNGEFDVLVGINLLREGLDIPEVALVVILDADKEGFLRSATSLIQTCGRAARNINGRVIMYADKKTSAIKNTLHITGKRRLLQEEYNFKNGHVPSQVIKAKPTTLEENFGFEEAFIADISNEEIRQKIKIYESKMKKAAKNFQFEDAIKYRDLAKKYKQLLFL